MERVRSSVCVRIPFLAARAAQRLYRFIVCVATLPCLVCTTLFLTDVSSDIGQAPYLEPPSLTYSSEVTTCTPTVYLLIPVSSSSSVDIRDIAQRWLRFIVGPRCPSHRLLRSQQDFQFVDIFFRYPRHTRLLDASYSPFVPILTSIGVVQDTTWCRASAVTCRGSFTEIPGHVEIDLLSISPSNVSTEFTVVSPLSPIPGLDHDRRLSFFAVFCFAWHPPAFVPWSCQDSWTVVGD